MDDRQLVHNFLNNRDEKAFHSIYTSKTPYLYKMAYRLTQSESQSDDLIQEMWIIAIGKLAEFQWRSELKTWLIGILINLERSKRKAQKVFVELNADLTLPETAIESNAMEAHDLEVAISKLPPGYRQVVILHDIEGFKHNEIAELLDIKEGTSKSQLFHARKVLRENLMEYQIKKNSHE